MFTDRPAIAMKAKAKHVPPLQLGLLGWALIRSKENIKIGSV